MEASLALQKAVRLRLVGSSLVTSLVSANSIVDKNARPEIFPCIIMGEGQAVISDGLARNRTHVYADLHLWATEPGLVQCKTIADAIRKALEDTIWSVEDHALADIYIASSRYLRDPDSIHSHGIVTLQAELMRFP